MGNLPANLSLEKRLLRQIRGALFIASFYTWARSGLSNDMLWTSLTFSALVNLINSRLIGQ